MTRIYFVRHGESLGNNIGRFYGNFDGHLTDNGRAQARAAGEYLKDVKFDAAYASDLSRAFETGSIIASFHNGLTLIPDKELREINAGEWEDQEFTYLMESGEDYNIWRSDFWNARPTGGESVQEITKRIYDAVWEIARRHNGQTVLIATHATPIRTLACRWLGFPYEKMQEVKWVNNASTCIVDFECETENTTVIVYNEHSYTVGMDTSLPRNV